MAVNRESAHSIDLALELEHQLNNEDHTSDHTPEPGLGLEVTTATNKTTMDVPQEGEQYDPEILTSIIIQLRASLVRITQERDESNEALVEAGNKNAALEARAADLNELLEKEKETSARLEGERDQATKTAQENEEQVSKQLKNLIPPFTIQKWT